MKLRIATGPLVLLAASAVACDPAPDPNEDGDSGTPGSDGGGRDASTPPSGPVVINYTDLASAPEGAFVTLFGFGLDAEVTGAEAVSQSPTRTVIRWAEGAAIGGVPVPVTTRPGRIVEATPDTLTQVCGDVQPGDVIYLRGGTYTARCGSTSWGEQQFNLGSEFAGVAIVGYPGEEATVNDLRLGDADGQAHGATIANLRMSGWYCVMGEQYWENEESGARDVRVVNIDCAGTYGDANTLTGLLSLGGDGWRVLGNRFRNDAPAPINNNHAIYIQVGADDVEVAWNVIRDMRLGHVIQLHTDGPERLYEDIRIHDNEIIGNDALDTRGIVISNCTNDSTASIYNNVLMNVGQDFSGIAVYCGQVDVMHNTLADIRGATLLMEWGSSFTVTARNNVFLGGAIAENAGELVESDNLTSGSVDASGRLGSPVRAPNVGIERDHAGVLRGSETTVGAYE